MKVHQIFCLVLQQKARCPVNCLNVTYWHAVCLLSLRFVFWHLLLPLRYDPRHNRWCSIQPMQQPHADHCVCVVGGLIYSIGGRDYTHELDSVERYDPHTNKWEFMSPLKREVRFISAWDAFIVHKMAMFAAVKASPFLKFYFLSFCRICSLGACPCRRCGGR